MSCENVLNLCFKAVQEQKKQVEIRDLRIKDDELQVDVLTKQNKDLAVKNDSFFRSPYLYLFLGLAAGFYVGKR
jgi:hypothetical protein